MKNQHLDLRIVRTRESIQNAFIELIEEKGFDAISVKDITTRANINRGTFYAHYEDKFDLMKKCEDEVMLELSTIVKENFPSVVASLEEDSPIAVPSSIAIVIFEYLNENSSFMRALLGPNGDLTFQTRLKKFMWKEIFENEAFDFVRKENFLVPADYLASYIASAHIGVIQQWLNSGRKESPEEMAKIFSIITFNGPFFAAGLKK